MDLSTINITANKTQTISLALLLVVFAGYIAIHVNDFYVPESDFFDYREKAIQIRNLDWPENSKRPPLYSAIIALISAPIPGRDRELYAAEIIGVISALFSLLLVYRISIRFLGKYAFFIAWLWALHPTTLRMAIKPKSEILVTVLILWAFDRYLKGNKRAYLLAFFATLVRYDGALAILAFGIADFLYDKHKVKTIIYTVLSGSFIVIWTFLQDGGGEGISYRNYFADYKPDLVFIKNLGGAIVGFLPIQLIKLWAAIGLVLTIIGILSIFMKNRRDGIAIVIYLLGFIVFYIIWPFSNIDYSILVSWNIFLLIFLGIKWAIKSLIMYFPLVKFCIYNRFATTSWTLASIVTFCIILVIYLNLKFPYPQYNVQWCVLVAFLIPLAIYLWWLLNHVLRARLSLCSLILGVFLIIAFYLNSTSNADLYNIHYSKAEFRLVGEWYEDNHQIGERMVVAQPKVVAYFTSLDPEKDFIRLVDLPQTTPENLLKWLKSQNAAYVAWLSHQRTLEEKNAWYIWKRENRGWKNIAFLENGQDIYCFKIAKNIRIGPRWAYIYKIQYSSYLSSK